MNNLETLVHSEDVNGFRQEHDWQCVLVFQLKAQRCQGGARGRGPRTYLGCVSSREELGPWKPGRLHHSLSISDSEKLPHRGEGLVVILSLPRKKAQETESEAAGAGAFRLVFRKAAICQSMLGISFSSTRGFLKLFLLKC